MRISTKGRYALRVMIDLAERGADEYIPLKEIAEKQDISEKYLESIMVVMSKGGLVLSLRGKGGGYKLAKPAQQYTVERILTLIEGSLAPVACLDCKPVQCARAGQCRTLPMWTQLDKIIHDYLSSVTLSDLVGMQGDGCEYII